MNAAARAYPGLELLASAVVLLDEHLHIEYINPAAETLFGVSHRAVVGQPFTRVFPESNGLPERLAQACARNRGFWDRAITLRIASAGEPLHVNCLATPQDSARVLLEIRRIDQDLRHERERELHSLAQANRELIASLAHEIKNPLGGLRGSAQLLERELDRVELREYTQVITKEADRLQLLVDRLLAPARRPKKAPVNIHEVTERAHTLTLAEFPEGVVIRTDYDASLPEIEADREQLIQAVLNVVRNAAQAIVASGRPGEILLKTRVARHVTIDRHHHRLAMELQVIDTGPGIPEALRDRIFNPLVSGREGGTGLGLTLALGLIEGHGGAIEAQSQSGRTVFRILLPFRESRP